MQVLTMAPLVPFPTGEEGEQQQYMFAVPVLEWADPHDETADVKKMYAMVDRLSYLDWGLRTDDEISGKRVAAKQRDTWDGCIVHDGAMWGEAHGENAMRVSDKGPKTAVTSEGYGEATVATVEKLLRLEERRHASAHHGVPRPSLPTGTARRRWRPSRSSYGCCAG